MRPAVWIVLAGVVLLLIAIATSSVMDERGRRAVEQGVIP